MDEYSKRRGCFGWFLYIVFGIWLIEFVCDSLYPEESDKKPKTGGCMKMLGVICLVIFAAAILNSCLFQ